MRESAPRDWKTWKDISRPGRIVFCEIGKSIRFAETVFADVTTLNFNLLFELGYCVGLNIPVRPIRDTNYTVDHRAFEELGILDSLTYIDFRNAQDLMNAAVDTDRGALSVPPKKTYRDTPVYVLKGPVDTEGTIRLLSTLKKSPLRYREHDPKENPRGSLYDHWKQVRGSFGVVANLLSPHRDGALAHNALCAFVAGVAMAEQKVVLMLQEEEVPQPIDYRDVVKTWNHPDHIPGLLERPITQVVERLQAEDPRIEQPPEGLLEQIDLGDPAAENEIGGLRDYFVRTSQFRQATNAHARLLVGRKGAGKTAMFYGVRSAVSRGLETLVLDMKPEGHQFTRLREAVLEELSEGGQEYTVAAFWTYLLSAEIAHKILNHPRELQLAERDGQRFARYQALQSAFFAHGLASGDDLSQRLLRQVDKLASRVNEAGDIGSRTDLAELLFGGDIKTLNDAVAQYVAAEKEQVWLLIDNLDKSWATRGSTPEDILLLRGLLESTRSLERLFDARGVELNCLVFIRTDVLEHLHAATPDRGKESAIDLDWDDEELLAEILRARIEASTGLDGSFAEVWRQLFAASVGTRDSFGYLVDRTLMRPRDLLMFTQRALQVAINRRHDKVSSDDILHAEAGYSEEALLWLSYEIEDTHPDLANALYAFQGTPTTLSVDSVRERLNAAGVPDVDSSAAIDLLLWFAFLGVELDQGGRLYSYTTRFNLRRLKQPIELGTGHFVIHPAFQAALRPQG